MIIYNRLVHFVLILGLATIAQGAAADSLSEGQDALMRGDDSSAVRLWTPPATAGDSEAQFRLGMMYLSGRGLATDKSTATRWLQLASEKHHVGASLALAKLYLDKADASYDPDAAIHLLRTVAENGVIEAQRYLGQIYRNGGGVSQDFSEAFHWFKRAAANSDIEAQVGLSELYRYGYGVEQNYPRAFMWMSLAASNLTNNSPERRSAAQSAVKRRNEMERLMTTEERAEAERLAIVCWQTKLQQCD